jgi:hypothetical protein
MALIPSTGDTCRVIKLSSRSSSESVSPDLGSKDIIIKDFNGSVSVGGKADYTVTLVMSETMYKELQTTGSGLYRDMFNSGSFDLHLEIARLDVSGGSSSVEFIVTLFTTRYDIGAAATSSMHVELTTQGTELKPIPKEPAPFEHIVVDVHVRKVSDYLVVLDEEEGLMMYD